MFLGQYVSSLMQETIAYLKLPFDKLAHQMSIPELVLRDAVGGQDGTDTRTMGQIWPFAGSANDLYPATRRARWDALLGNLLPTRLPSGE
jgi:hypothetical protein